MLPSRRGAALGGDASGGSAMLETGGTGFKKPPVAGGG